MPATLPTPDTALRPGGPTDAYAAFDILVDAMVGADPTTLEALATIDRAVLGHRRDTRCRCGCRRRTVPPPLTLSAAASASIRSWRC